jgi:hypothetical protein
LTLRSDQAAQADDFGAAFGDPAASTQKASSAISSMGASAANRA